MKLNAEKIIQILYNNGYEAYFIGGSVRNMLHNFTHNDKLPIKDYDIVTNASYDQIESLFPEVESRGEAFKVAIVKIEGHEFEVAQYRGDIYPEGGSLRPTEVYAVETLKEDVQRRDFTINGIALDKTNIIDHVNGSQDIKDKIIRTIGNSSERFAEDPLRMLRAFRFQAQLGYTIEEETLKGIKKNIDLLSTVPHDRVKEEINKLIKSRYAGLALTTMRNTCPKEIKFLNTITGKKPFVFKKLFSLSNQKFNSSVCLIDKINKSEFSLEQIYAILYKDVSILDALSDIENMGVLNKKTIKEFTILLKNINISFFQSRECLLKLARDVDLYGDGKRSTLNRILNFYSKVFDVNFKSFEQYFKRPLLKRELAYSGNDILRVAKKHGINEAGQWVSEAIELARTRSVMGEKFNLNTVLNLISKKIKI